MKRLHGATFGDHSLAVVTSTLLLFAVSAEAAAMNGNNAGCEALTTSGSADKKPFVVNVAEGRNLDGALARARDDNVVIALHVINGTKWLNLGGDIDQFKLVVGAPPKTSSDISLEEALERIGSTLKTPRVLIVTKDRQLFPAIRALVKPYSRTMYIWLPFPPEPVEGDNSLPLFDLTSKTFGLDVAFERVQSENLLQPFDFERMRNILSEAFSSSGQVPEDDLNYIKRKSQSLPKEVKNTFTELYVTSVVKLVAPDEDGVSGGDSNGNNFRNGGNQRPGSGPRRSPSDFLSDLQRSTTSAVSGDSAGYTEQDLSKLKDRLRSNSARLQEATCMLVRVRAGVLVQGRRSMEQIRDLINEWTSMKVLVRSEEYDDVSTDQLSQAVNFLGRDKVVLDVPERLLRSVVRGGGDSGSDGFNDDQYDEFNGSRRNGSKDGRFGGNDGHEDRFGGNGGRDDRFGGNDGHEDRFGGNGDHEDRFGGNDGHEDRFGNNGDHEDRFGGNGDHEDRFRGNNGQDGRFRGSNGQDGSQDHNDSSVRHNFYSGDEEDESIYRGDNGDFDRANNFNNNNNGGTRNRGQQQQPDDWRRDQGQQDYNNRDDFNGRPLLRGSSPGNQFDRFPNANGASCSHAYLAGTVLASAALVLKGHVLT